MDIFPSDRAKCWALAAVVAVACTPAGGGKPVVTPPALTVTDYEPARGATSLWTSPDGKYMAAELIFAGEEVPAVIKVIERASGKVVAHARGSLVAGPNNSGEVVYVNSADRAHPVLRSTTRPAFAAPLPAASGDFARWSGFRQGATHDRVAVLRQEVDLVAISLIRLSDAATVATRTLPKTELMLLAVAVSPSEDLLYLSGKTPGTSAAGAVIALDGGTLQERWRVPWSEGHNFDARPTLGVTGDGSIVAAYAPSGLLTMDAHHGRGAKVVSFYGHDPEVMVGVPGRAALVVLRTFHASGERPAYSIEQIELPSGEVTKLRLKAGPLNPAAVAVVGTMVVVASGSPPRSPSDPSTWGPELDGFVKK